MEFNDRKAIFLQIADLIYENILLGKWKPGDRIPSVREMAVNMEVNPNTVMRTFNFLQDKEIIYNKRGIGYFVAEDGLSKTRRMRRENFIEQEIPRLFREMDLLDLRMEDLKVLYEKYKANPNSEF